MRTCTQTQKVLRNIIVAATFVFAASSATLFAATIELGKAVNPRDAAAEFAAPNIDKNTASTRSSAKPLTIAGQEYATGIGTQVNTTIAIAPNGATRFAALVGVDDATDAGAVARAAVVLDGKTVWSNDSLRRGDKPAQVGVDIPAGAKEIRLITEDVGHALTHAHVDWVNASFEYTGEAGDAPKSIAIALTPVVAPYILTPKPGPEPRINSARIFGARPDHPFLYTVAATGERPMQFSADNLPDGLALDAATGRITGSVAKAGSYDVTLHAKNARGSADRKLRIEIGERVSLTPPLGWNSWNCWGASVDQEKVLAAAKAMAASGLADHGWTYINIDDAWQGARGGAHKGIQPNEKFPDMPGLAKTVHGLGLKLGIYSTPWKTSYAGYVGGSSDSADGAWEHPARAGDPQTRGRNYRTMGQYPFAANDAKQWSDWGIDYLKYDWNPNRFPETSEMFKALRDSGRDILLSLSNSMPFDNIAEIQPVANSWRTTGDIRDNWASVQRIGFSQDKWRKFGGPGHWNDPDMLVVDYVGWGPRLHPSGLTPDEQYTHITLWCLLCSPMLLGCDLERLDDFALNLLTNDEVLEVSQDPRGEQAAQTWTDGRRQIWMKTLEDGSRAIGVFNLSQKPDTIEVDWKELGLEKPFPSRVRDLWRQKDITADSDSGVTLTVPAHGCYLLRVW